MPTGELPTEYLAGRFFLLPETKQGVPLRFFTDTGGADFISESAVSRLGLRTESFSLGGEHYVVVDMPEFRRDAWIPSISTGDDPRSPEFQGRLLVRPDKPERTDSDGTLGQAWFGGRVWTFDYSGQRLVLEAADSKKGARGVSVGFPIKPNGRRGTNFPSIEATILGETHAFLFDTGATAYLTEEGRSLLGGPPNQATCFVTAHIFDRWRENHDDWRFIEHGDRNVGGQAMIEVPSVNIAGLNSGPVWFTRRPDTNFHQFMSSMMDRRVEGALGGSLFQYFRTTLDYPQALAYLELA